MGFRHLFLFIIILSNALIINAQDDSIEPDQILVTYNAFNKPLPTVLIELSKVSKQNIVFAQTKVVSKRLVSIQAKQEKLGSILKVILDPYRLDYQVIGNSIVIISKRSSDFGKILTLNGYIKDAETGEVLPYANIVSNDNKYYTSANANGYYTLSLPLKAYTLLISYTGYKEDTIREFIDTDRRLDILLKNNIELNEVIIYDEFKYSDGNQLGKEKFTKNQISKSNFLLGEADLFRGIGMSAGVSSGADGFGGLSVRGGNNDQNLILLDGVPLQYNSHAFGLVSVFNSSIIQEATLHKGDFPTSYGGKMSSIIDIKTREGNNQQFGGEVSLSTLTTKVTLEGPLVKEKASFIISGRRSFADLWLKPLSRYQNDISGDEGESNYAFFDINAKINATLGKNHKAFVSFFQGNDDFNNFRLSRRVVSEDTFEDRQEAEQFYGSKSISAQLHSIWTKNLFGRFIAYNSDWAFENFTFNQFYAERLIDTTDIYQSELKRSFIANKGLRYEVDWFKSTKFTVKGGIAIQESQLQPKFAFDNNILSGPLYPDVVKKEALSNSHSDISVKNVENTAFGEALFYLNNRSYFKAGLHTSMFISGRNKYLSFQPRLAYSVTGDLADFKVSLSRMQQFDQVLSSNQLGLPSDIWVTVNDKIKPADSWIFAAGVGFTVGDIDVRLDGYGKYMTGLLALNEGQVVVFDSTSTSWATKIPVGKGTAFGAEVNVSKKIGKTLIALNYTLSSSKRDFYDLNNGKVFDYRFNRPHNANLQFTHVFGEKADVNFNIVYGTGDPVTIPTSEIIELVSQDGEKFLSIVYEEKNAQRLPDYFRVDLSFNFYTDYKFGKQKFSLGVYNITNQRNPLYLDIKRNRFDANQYELNSVSILPLLPSVNYSLSF